jgi:Icc-related predicted phosphoesterase
MRVWAISDLHLDYEVNRTFFYAISEWEYKEDILIVGGDVHHEYTEIKAFFRSIVPKFKQVLFVPGNHDVWLTKTDKFKDSMEKYQQLLLLAKEEGVRTTNYQVDELTIVPLHSWYDFTFGQPNTVIQRAWQDFKYCIWQDSVETITSSLLAMNKNSLNPTTEKVISFSHFLPYAHLIPAETPPIVQALKPVMGCMGLAKQIEELKPQIHLYGHSHLNRKIGVKATVFVNNAYGYPKERHITRKRLYCIYNNGNIVW